MRIKNIIITGLISSTGAFMIKSCKSEPFRALPVENITPIVTERLDSIAKTSQIILKDKNYKKFGVDTLKITREFFNNPTKYVKNLNKCSECNPPDPSYNPDFIKTKTVITSQKIFTRNGTDMFIPVEYYGLPNPKPQKLRPAITKHSK